jgi:hypothetical protein
VDINGATLGCGLVPSTSSINSGIKKLRVKICRRHRNGYFAAADLWAEQIKHYQPNIVVVLAGRWEEHTLLFRGKWQTIFNAPIRRSMAHSIALITSDARASGARTVLLTMPCVPQGEANDGSVFPENQPGRQRAYNQVLRHVARQLHDPVINLNAMVCPNGVVAHVLDGYLVRAYDGVHFGADSAPFLAPRLFPKLVRLGQAK